MEIIHGGRGSGKTTKLIQMIKEFGGVLVVSSSGMKKLLVTQGILAKDQVVTFQEKRNYRGERRRYWIDSLEMLIEEQLGPGCEGFSIDTPTSITKCRFLDKVEEE